MYPSSFKRWLSVCLLLVFSYQVMLCHLSLWAWKCYMQECIEDVAKSLSNESLESITLSYNGTTESEFEHEGSMYDVIRFTITGNAITYYCIKDFTESALKTGGDDLSGLASAARNQLEQYASKLAKKMVEKFIPGADFLFRLSYQKSFFTKKKLTLPPSLVYEVEITPPRLG